MPGREAGVPRPRGFTAAHSGAGRRAKAGSRSQRANSRQLHAQYFREACHFAHGTVRVCALRRGVEYAFSEDVVGSERRTSRVAAINTPEQLAQTYTLPMVPSAECPGHDRCAQARTETRQPAFHQREQVPAEERRGKTFNPRTLPRTETFAAPPGVRTRQLSVTVHQRHRDETSNNNAIHQC